MKKSGLLFYEIMNYPIPKYWEYFSTTKKTELPKINHNDFSRSVENPLMQEYRDEIKKYQNIFKSIPWIQEVYVCNSITFNGLNNNSDIDLFIISKQGSIRKTRLISLAIFFILGIKRHKDKIKKKFCLSFYISENAKNLYNISIENTDIYLAYRLAHLVPIYQTKKHNKTIYQNNLRIQSILPNIPIDKHTINILVPTIYGKTKIKEKIEKHTNRFISKILENIIKIVWTPILSYKTKKLKNIGKNIIFHDQMLKFYKDERKKISLLYRSKATNNQR